MIKNPTFYLVVAGALAFAGCKEENSQGYKRIETLPAAKDVPAAMPAVLSSNNAGPLPRNIDSHTHDHEHDHAHDHATTDGVANNTDAVIQAGETQVMAGGNILQAAGLAFTVDESWKNIKPSSAMRVAQYQLEGSGGAAEMAIFYFGQGQGGGIEDNIRRWAGQFTPEPGDAETTDGAFQVGRVQKDNLQLALVKTEGTYDPGSMGPMGPASTGPKPGYALFGLVVEGGPEGSLFIKVTGPKATLKEHDQALEAFAQSVRVSGYK